MVKSSDAKTLGTVKDASLDPWPSALARVSERYASETSIVVPGHVAHGGVELLGHTADLLLRPALPARRDVPLEMRALTSRAS